jgi:hypothetical protein
MDDRSVDEMSPSIQRDPAKRCDLVNGERLRIKTKVLVLRIVSSSDFP